MTTNYWKSYTHQLREGLLQRVDELSVSDYPEATPNQVIHFLQDFLKQLADVIDKAESEERLKMINSLVRGLGVFLEWLDNAHTEQTPRGLVQLLKDLINRMDPDSRVMARPQAQYNYSILPLGSLLKKLVDDYIPHSKQSLFNEHLSSPIKLISFPRIQRDDILGHAIFGHELGHPVADLYLESENTDEEHLKAHSNIQKQVARLVDEKLSNSASDDQKLEWSTKIFDHVLQVRKRALEELISDSVGILIFGPSAFFACYELLWGGNWDAKPSPNEWYPPSRMRIRIMLELMDRLSFIDAFDKMATDGTLAPYVESVKAFIEEARKVASVTNDQTGINNDPQLKIAYDWMNSSLDKAIHFARQNTEKVAFDSDIVFPQLQELLQRLELGVPPNEVGDPANLQTVDYRSSLLAAWMFKLRSVYPSTGDTVSSQEIEKLHQKTLTAIEYVILQEEYSQYFASQS
ncbi:hypothetical protein [Thiohalobacter thiocyanaticus]|uniref:hypothetical protein n=1 Tax=Thiohalobacter thiocyanaticus TaxID=585455 RepID=UPI000F6342C8|nr:hypothetical protein [Thiohalobacter thiocyanaticus]